MPSAPTDSADEGGPKRVFLTAEWRHLVLLSYAVDPDLLRPHVPRGTELDAWRGETYVSLVGFLFLDTRVLGVPVPFHRAFEEVNLRFYVRREERGEVRRAVTFLKEIVPRRAVAAVARWVYGERYVAHPMTHRIVGAAGETPREVEYGWRADAGEYALRLATDGPASEIEDGSAEEFISEHYWGYVSRRGGSTLEYQVEHPRWRVRRASRSAFEGDAARLYGPELGAVLTGKPASAFYADGSAVRVMRGRKLDG